MGEEQNGDGRYSVAFPKRWWYPASPSSALKHKPIGITLMDRPIALFRDADGTAHALLDRCAHRNVPLSLGRVHDDGCLECAYHGWRFDGAGECRAIPGLAEPVGNRGVDTWPTRERDGFVWVWGDPASAPDREPFALPVLDHPWGEAVFRYDLDCTVHAAAENALDVPHTAFLHRGIFRGGEPRELTAVRRELADGVEVQYLGEPVGLGRLRGRDGSELVFDHWDRFFLPSIAQVEYRVKHWLQIVNTILHLPLSPFRTRAWFVVRYRTPVPPAVAKPIVLGRGWQIARQDVDMLARQTENIRRFKGERYSSTDLDLMANAIWRLMRQAERAESGTAAVSDAEREQSVRERRVTFTV